MKYSLIKVSSGVNGQRTSLRKGSSIVPLVVRCNIDPLIVSIVNVFLGGDWKIFCPVDQCDPTGDTATATTQTASAHIFWSSSPAFDCPCVSHNEGFNSRDHDFRICSAGNHNSVASCLRKSSDAMNNGIFIGYPERDPNCQYSPNGLPRAMRYLIE
jgi:hypothetical protein